MTDDTYDLKSTNLPKLSGRALSAFTRMVESRGAGGVLLERLMKDSGLELAREVRVAEPPSYVPSRPAPAGGGGAAPLLDAVAAAHGRPAPFPSVRAYAQAYRGGRTTPVQVAQAVLAAVAESDAREPPLRAFVAIDRDDVLRQAREATERHRRGAPLGPLDGVPVAIKDEIDQVPYVTTGGTAFKVRVRRPAEDATVVARLRAAGALLVGKANMHEIGINPNGLNVHHGQVRNPYDATRDSGGSSSGSAAAVAAGLVPLALGADGGGSVRIPAALCGVVGLKATWGRISDHGAFPLCWSVAHPGPLGATVADVALAYAVIAGADPKDPNTMGQPAPTLDGWNRQDLRGVRLGVHRAWFEHADAEVVRVNRAMLDQLVSAGAELREVVVPELELMRVAHAITILSEMAAGMSGFPEDRRTLGDSVRLTLAITRALRSEDFVWAQRVRTRALGHFDRIFGSVDAVVTPATAIVAPRIPVSAPGVAWSDLNSTSDVMRFVFPGNLAGLPAIAFPVGYGAGGLPIGMQAMAAHWNEALLLRIAHVAEGLAERRAPARLHAPLHAAT